MAMTATITDHRPALWLKRAQLVTVLNSQRNALAQICGCDRCGGSAARTQLLGLIHKNMTTLDGMNDLISQRPPREATSCS
jgi:hypothetical protein